MRCGTKYFEVELDEEFNEKVMTVPARTPAEARKIVRHQCGADVQILTVREQRQGLK